MDKNAPIPVALQRIGAVLDASREYPKQAADIHDLWALTTSGDTDAEARFRQQITTGKWYWLGMGTIADISLPNPAAQREFVSAYHALATACRDAGLASAYSTDVEEVFGRWLHEKHL